MNPLDAIFKPQTIAVIGAAHALDKPGGVILKNLGRFRGKVYPVNPKYSSVMEMPCYPSLDDLPEAVDLSLIIRPAIEVPEILSRHKGRARAVIIVSSGFAETGHAALQDDISRIGKEIGVRILGPNCMGLYNPRKNLDTFLLPFDVVRRPLRGNIAVISQSGAVIHCLFGVMRASRMGVSVAVTYGNAIDIDEADLYDYIRRDRSTRVVLSYIESVRDGRRFLRSAQRVSEEKPLIILKSGRGSSGQTAAFSHTGRLAGNYEVFKSILRLHHIREVQDFEEFTDSAMALSFQPPSSGKRVLIITDGGGSGVLASDECMRQGLVVDPLPDEKKKKLQESHPDFYVFSNPIDLTAQVKEDDYISVLDELKEHYDGFLVIALTGVPGITTRIAGLLKKIKTDLAKPLVVHMSCGCESSGIIKEILKARIPVYNTPERAVKGLKVLLHTP